MIFLARLNQSIGFPNHLIEEYSWETHQVIRLYYNNYDIYVDITPDELYVTYMYGEVKIKIFDNKETKCEDSSRKIRKIVENLDQR